MNNFQIDVCMYLPRFNVGMHCAGDDAGYQSGLKVGQGVSELGAVPIQTNATGFDYKP